MSEQTVPPFFDPLPGFICPPSFWSALGYEREARYVAIHWEASSNTAAYSDGREESAGAYTRAYRVLLNYNFPPTHEVHRLCGTADSLASHWLVVDRQGQRAWLAPWGKAEVFLVGQHPPPQEENDEEENGEIFERVLDATRTAVGKLAEKLPGELNPRHRAFRVFLDDLGQYPRPW